jgi:hypothetical protein
MSRAIWNVAVPRPFRVEQVGVALGRLLRLHEIGVVGDRAEEHAEAREGAVRVLVLGGVMLRHVLGHEGLEPALLLPDDQMGGIRRVDHVDRMDVAAVLLPDALEDALRARALHAAGDAGELRFERSGDALRERQIDGRVPDDLAFLPRRLNERRRDRGWRRCGSPHRRGENLAAGESGRALEKVTSR